MTDINTAACVLIGGAFLVYLLLLQVYPCVTEARDYLITPHQPVRTGAYQSKNSPSDLIIIKRYDDDRMDARTDSCRYLGWLLKGPEDEEGYTSSFMFQNDKEEKVWRWEGDDLITDNKKWKRISYDHSCDQIPYDESIASLKVNYKVKNF